MKDIPQTEQCCGISQIGWRILHDAIYLSGMTYRSTLPGQRRQSLSNPYFAIECYFAALQQNPSRCTQRHAHQVAFSLRKSCLAPSFKWALLLGFCSKTNQPLSGLYRTTELSYFLALVHRCIRAGQKRLHRLTLHMLLLDEAIHSYEQVRKTALNKQRPGS
jgi:hypothetical protein